MPLINLGSNAHYDVDNEKLLEPLREVTITKSATNPGGATTLWIRASDGVLMLGTNPISTGSSVSNAKARIVHGGNYTLLTNTAYELIPTPATGLFFNFGISPGTFTNPSPGIIKYNGLDFARVNLVFMLVPQMSGAAQTLELALSLNGNTSTSTYFLSPAVNSAVPINIHLDTSLTPGVEFGFAYKLSAGNSMLIRSYYLYVEYAA